MVFEGMSNSASSVPRYALVYLKTLLEKVFNLYFTIEESNTCIYYHFDEDRNILLNSTLRFGY